MDIFKRLGRLFSGQPPQQPGYWIYVQTHRCKEKIATRINLNADLSLQDDDSYYVRKLLTGTSRCFEQVEVELFFDAQRNLVEQKISGGTFITAEAYEADGPDADES